MITAVALAGLTLAVPTLPTSAALASTPPDRPPLTVTIRCYNNAGPVYDPESITWDYTFVIDRWTRDFSEPWGMEFPDEAICTLEAVNSEPAYDLEEPVTEAEVAHWEASEPEYRDFTLSIVYEQCVEHGTTWTTQEWPVSPNQVPEVLELLEFCPGHPDRQGLEERIEAMGVVQDDLDAGRRFGGGLHRVGEDIQPGAYFSESEDGFENCYWERQDSTGHIIENNYAGRVFRVEVIIDSTDFAFLSDGCGAWQPLE